MHPKQVTKILHHKKKRILRKLSGSHSEKIVCECVIIGIPPINNPAIAELHNHTEDLVQTGEKDLQP